MAGAYRQIKCPFCENNDAYEQGETNPYSVWAWCNNCGYGMHDTDDELTLRKKRLELRVRKDLKKGDEIASLWWYFDEKGEAQFLGDEETVLDVTSFLHEVVPEIKLRRHEYQQETGFEKPL